MVIDLKWPVSLYNKYIDKQRGYTVVEINKDKLIESIKQVESILNKIHAIDLNKLNKSQQTLIIRRVEALEISVLLMKEKLRTYEK
ncbi:Uncharacterised protein [Acholeplasma oculi]|uniref:hypothetical protein n=1 Tax=Acholeplasma oculi TaxID=35623 RepID=UPI0009D43C01|nr:hypothetical protein [Acholeplasma oculi]SKC43309.1 hypothetical protein SAMN02745122_0956 [Acholeplasma oculi]SUT88728.1 Uncharacterised protein [Acholeplasma oculi]